MDIQAITYQDTVPTLERTIGSSESSSVLIAQPLNNNPVVIGFIYVFV